MKILYHHRVASKDGQAVHIEEMAHALRQEGHEVIMVGPPGFDKTDFGGSSPTVDRVKRLIPAFLFELLEIAYNLKAFARLFQQIRRHRPDVIYERFSLFLFAGIWAKSYFKLPLLLEVNSPLYEERFKNDGLRWRKLARWAQDMIWHRADHLLPVTDVLSRIIQDYGVPPWQITVIPNAVNMDRFVITPDAKAKLKLEGYCVIGFTGFLREWNMLPFVVDFAAFHEEFNPMVLVVGDGPAREPLVACADLKGIPDRLRITGVVGRDEVAAYISAFDIAVVPNATPYSSPLKLFEYMAMGRAIVAPNVPNIREVLTDEHDALLFEVDDYAMMRSHLTRLCEDPELRERLGQAARMALASRGISWTCNAKLVVAHAEELLDPNDLRVEPAESRFVGGKCDECGGFASWVRGTEGPHICVRCEDAKGTVS